MHGGKQERVQTTSSHHPREVNAQVGEDSSLTHPCGLATTGTFRYIVGIGRLHCISRSLQCNYLQRLGGKDTALRVYAHTRTYPHATCVVQINPLYFLLADAQKESMSLQAKGGGEHQGFWAAFLTLQ